MTAAQLITPAIRLFPDLVWCQLDPAESVCAEYKRQRTPEIRGEASATELIAWKLTSPPAVQDDLLRDAFLGTLTLRIQKVDDPVASEFAAINDMADPQRWFFPMIRAIHE
jgi:hypothetical protein